MGYIGILGSALLFMLVISIDLFVCGLGFGLGKVHVSFRKVILINLIGTFMIGVGLFAGYYLRSFISESAVEWIAFSVLFGLGLYKVVQWCCKKENTETVRPITWPEACILGIGLSLDGMAIGLGVTIGNMGMSFIVTAIVLSLVTDPLVFAIGQFVGKRLTKRARLDLSWLSGALLVMIATVGLVI